MGRRRDVKRCVASIDVVLDLGKKLSAAAARVAPSLRVARARAGEAVSKPSTAASSAIAIAFIRRRSAPSSIMACCNPFCSGIHDEAYVRQRQSTTLN